MSFAIETIVEDDQWRKAINDPEGLVSACAAAAVAFEPKLRGEAALLLTDDAALRAMNQQFRGRDEATNVLSFPSAAMSPKTTDFLGDVAIGREICEREAAQKGVSLRDHVAHLTIHGILHLLGYDHQTDSEASLMEARETEILARLGIGDPYASAVETI